MYKSCVNNNFCPNNINNEFVQTVNGCDNNMEYAHSYVKTQVLGEVFSPMEGLSNGTMFPDLISPYHPGQSLEEMNYLKYGNRGGMM